MGICAKDMPKRHRLKIALVPAPALALAMLAMGTYASAAEVRGVVSVQQAGMFDDHGEMLKSVPVSVALFPAEGQALPRRAVEEHAIALSGSRMLPVYLAIPRGDRVRFENQDNVYHELFTHSHTQALELRLDRTGLDRERTLTLNEADDLHWFCRIHAKSYARVDVLDTPLVHMMNAGDSFEFRNLAPGKWRIRVAAPGAETRTVEALALTAPPPLRIQLAVKGFNQDTPAAAPAHAVAIEQLFPNRPGL
ncbi:MAG: hypothetical protein HY941_12480 [Gammaproteobacteria bacterium]|nr:hypothetical protein [Gammaproteobacteria bacterium]